MSASFQSDLIVLLKQNVYSDSLQDRTLNGEVLVNSLLSNKRHNILFLNCLFGEPLADKLQQCQEKGGEIYLDSTYFSLLLRELINSEIYRLAFIKKWSREISKCHKKNYFNSNGSPLMSALKCLKTEDGTVNPQHQDQTETLIETSPSAACSLSSGSSCTSRDNLSRPDSSPSINTSYKVQSTVRFPALSMSKENDLGDLARQSSDLGCTKFPVLTLHISSCFPAVIDKRWCWMVHQSVQERIQLDESMSWLSTLGGACSALGDYNSGWANKAAFISSQQRQLAWRIGDPAILARCELYLAIALIQKGKYKAASAIIRREYNALRRKPADLRDQRLGKMCQGIWVKLHYTKKHGSLT